MTKVCFVLFRKEAESSYGEGNIINKSGFIKAAQKYLWAGMGTGAIDQTFKYTVNTFSHSSSSVGKERLSIYIWGMDGRQRK